MKGQLGNFKHGYARKSGVSRVWICWRSMWQRCTDPKNISYPRYGGRGIAVCERWRDFPAFLRDMGEPPAGTSIDRWPNNDGNYEPGNCRWATQSDQTRNQTRSLHYTFNGETLPAREWSERLGGYPDLVRNRIVNLGWSVDRAVTEPGKFKLRKTA